MIPPLICVDAGHGGTDPGAVAGGVRESDVVLTHALALGAALERVGCAVLYTRTTDRYLTRTARAQAANEYGARVFVSVHANASVNARASGAWIIYKNGDGVGQKLAESVAAYLDANVRPDKDGDAAAYPDASGWTTHRELTVLRATRMPAILVELGFLTNEGDRARLLDSAHTELIAAAIAAEVARALMLGVLT